MAESQAADLAARVVSLQPDGKAALDEWAWQDAAGEEGSQAQPVRSASGALWDASAPVLPDVQVARESTFDHAVATC
ncbi:MAG: hypothetical protein AMXMBFR7_43470 [Planctomycetota bacterium]